MAKVYDVVVVGSGAAGGMAATQLCLKGLKVLMLERGPKFNIATDFAHHRKLFLTEQGYSYRVVIADEP